MKKKEIIWRYILEQKLQKTKDKFMQKEIAAHFGFSTSTVFNALKIPRKLGAVSVTGRFFRLINTEKLLLLWATQRNIEKDIIYSTNIEKSVREIEGMMPENVIFGAFSAYRLHYNDAPADYSLVYIYSNNIDEIKKRFGASEKNKHSSSNLFVLKPDPFLSKFGQITPDSQTFVDLWNVSAWYAHDFLKSLKEKMKPELWVS